jgi:hypothetical protein
MTYVSGATKLEDPAPETGKNRTCTQAVAQKAHAAQRIYRNASVLAKAAVRKRD